MSYYYLQTSNDHLAHHGILGMKWGIRRYQPYAKGSKGGKEIGLAAKKSKGGSLRERREERRAQRREINNYNYRNSESYKNLDAKRKRRADRNYKVNVKDFGAAAANKIEYNIREKGSNFSAERAKAILKDELVTEAAISGTIFAIGLAGIAVNKVKNKIALNKAVASCSNIVVENIASSKGLNTIKGRPTVGYRNYLAGRAIIEKFSGH